MDLFMGLCGKKKVILKENNTQNLCQNIQLDVIVWQKLYKKCDCVVQILNVWKKEINDDRRKESVGCTVLCFFPSHYTKIDEEPHALATIWEYFL